MASRPFARFIGVIKNPSSRTDPLPYNDVYFPTPTVCKPPTVYCDSISCPDLYVSIDNADEVECDDDPCEVSQCCGEHNQTRNETRSDSVYAIIRQYLKSPTAEISFDVLGEHPVRGR